MTALTDDQAQFLAEVACWDFRRTTPQQIAFQDQLIAEMKRRILAADDWLQCMTREAYDEVSWDVICAEEEAGRCTDTPSEDDAP